VLKLLRRRPRNLERISKTKGMPKVSVRGEWGFPALRLPHIRRFVFSKAVRVVRSDVFFRGALKYGFDVLAP
jgi:hypothetical protein